MPLVDTRRGRLFCAIHSGPPEAPSAILIHGAGGSHLSFPAQLRRSRSWRALLPDLPGHGGSPGPGRRSMADYALDIVALLDALEIESALIMGHSMGGAIAQQIALDQPRRTLALVLLCTGARLPVNPHLVEGIVAEPETTLAMLSRWMWSRDAPAAAIKSAAAIMRATPPAVFQADLQACASHDLRGRLPGINAPTLVLAGQQDRMTPPALSEELAAGIADCQLRILAGAGHMPHLEQPEATAQTIAAWLAGLDL